MPKKATRKLKEGCPDLREEYLEKRWEQIHNDKDAHKYALEMRDEIRKIEDKIDLNSSALEHENQRVELEIDDIKAKAKAAKCDLKEPSMD